MSRLPDIRRNELNAEAQAVYDEIAGSRGEVRGPFVPLMHHPALAGRVAALGEQIRFRSVLSGAERELAILAAGREVEALYEWAAHEPIGLREGTSKEAVEVVRNHQSTNGLAPREALIIEVVRSLYREHRIADGLYQRAEAEFGREGMVELVVTAGYYGMIGFVLNAFDVQLPAGVQPAFTRA